jgi:ArsR family transcriptional regulator, arsenate/arsenite/antimonite-responsive transcriptional repressor / arsenate reductase (thioredoxin)
MLNAHSPDQSLRFLKLMGHDLRWQLMAALARSDRQVQELARLLDQPQNLVSYHLKRLRSLDLVRERRSAADGRDIYYNLNFEQVRELYVASAAALHPALVETEQLPADAAQRVRAQPVRILFLCTENSARSQMAEGILRQLSHGQVDAFSAGSAPAPVHPDAVRALSEMGIDISGQIAKSIDVFRGQSFDYIVTVCDRVREACPSFPDDPQRIHWSFPDPAASAGDEAARYRSFQQTALQLTTRIRYLLIQIEREKG